MRGDHLKIKKNEKKNFEKKNLKKNFKIFFFGRLESHFVHAVGYGPKRVTLKPPRPKAFWISRPKNFLV